jgi:UDP-glucose 4-epimerase
MGMKIVVTGGAGFIGSHIAERLAAAGHEVSVLDDLSAGARDNVSARVKLVELDVASTEASAFVASTAPAVIVHCAAQSSVAASFDDPVKDARSNLLGTLQMLRGAVDAQSSRFVYLTTGGALYGEAELLPTSEEAPARPLSPYGLSKWAGEEYLRRLAPERLVVSILRLANVFGPRQRADGEGGVVSIFLDQMLRREQVEIFGDGDQTRDFVYVGDVVDAVRAAMDADRSVTVNIGTGVGTSINSLFERAAEVTGYQADPVHLAPRVGEVRHSLLDVTAAFESLRWTSHTDLESGLRLTAAAVRGRR